LLLTSGELVGVVGHAITETDTFEHFGGASASFAAAHGLVRQREGDIV
jgi:hypothetical protein